VLLANSTAKKSNFSSETELHKDKCSKVLESPQMLSLGDVVLFTKAVKVTDIVKISVGQNLLQRWWKLATLKKLKKKTEDGKEFRNATVKVGDETESCRLVLWEEDVVTSFVSTTCYYSLSCIWSHNFVLMIIHT
jgi:hypothetical protein